MISIGFIVFFSINWQMHFILVNLAMYKIINRVNLIMLLYDYVVLINVIFLMRKQIFDYRKICYLSYCWKIKYVFLMIANVIFI